MKKIFALFCIPFLLFAVPNPPNRASQAPYISGDAFRSISDYVYDELDQSLDPKDVSAGSAIFVKPENLQDFFTKIHPFIAEKYILITHNSDLSVPGVFSQFLDDRTIVAWFGQNYDGYQHPKMHAIPIGVANFCWPHGNVPLFQWIMSLQLPKRYLLHMSFSVNTWFEERAPLFWQFVSAPFCYSPREKPFYQYWADIALSQFELSPRGNGLDTHRIWESLYLGTTPIVKSSSLDSLFTNLPIIIVQEWTEINEQFLHEQMQHLQKRTFHLERLSMDYWSRLIDSYKELCR